MKTGKQVTVIDVRTQESPNCKATLLCPSSNELSVFCN